MRIQRENIGLWAFYGGLVLALLLAFALRGLWGDTWRNDMTKRYRAEIAKIEAQRQPGDLVVYIFGNSRLRNDIALGVKAKPEILPNGRRAYFLRFAEDAAYFENYEAVWPDILASKPDVIAFMPYLMTRKKIVDYFALYNLPDSLYRIASNLVTGRSTDEMWRLLHIVPHEDCYRERDFNRQALQVNLGFLEKRDHATLENLPDRVKARKAVGQALADGVQIVMLSLPPNMDRLKALDVPRDVFDYYGLGFMPLPAQILPDLHDRVLWREAPSLPATDYCDFSHMNEKGRAKTTEWFLDMLDALPANVPAKK